MNNSARDVVTITQTSESRDRSATGEAAAESAIATSAEESETLLCWICRQPLDELERVHWRGEPVHYDCL